MKINITSLQRKFNERYKKRSKKPKMPPISLNSCSRDIKDYTEFKREWISPRRAKKQRVGGKVTKIIKWDDAIINKGEE